MNKKKKRRPLVYVITDNNCFEVHDRSTDVDGYPKITVDKKQQSVHRFIYKECFGEIPDGLLVRHKCDNRKCCNPEHLELGTNQDNMNDMKLRNPNIRGSKNGSAKLTEDQVYVIKERLFNGEKLVDIAKDCNVNQIQIRKIGIGELWNHVKYKDMVVVYEKKGCHPPNLVTNSKLNEEKVMKIKIKLRNGQSCRSIAKEYDVNKSTIIGIKNNKNWTHVQLEQ